MSHAASKAVDVYGFQSLFSWNLLLMRSKRADLIDLRFVSILVFVELALDGWTKRMPITSNMGFQSLFSWNLLLMDRTLGKTDAIEYPVSILVFVELALDGLRSAPSGD